ncbi:GDSL-type esterase/lipase family protein [Paenibacillus agricola]|uniref:Lipase n=1 Tax=Paenibacillus agricola TaxID=2716264 RepID=A0ABX0J7U1_9BACL|nr:GDSL-type esterase/lipase family protein [Paenibacillus agricola]NHN31450.1 lipase [Paenibacillus agricola]
MLSWKIKWLLVVSLVANLILMGIHSKSSGFSMLANKGTSIIEGTQEEGETTSYSHRKSLFELLPVHENSIVFLGDSLTEYNEWHEEFGKEWILNRGISGDTTSGILKRLDHIIDIKASKIFLMVGINDLGNGKSVGSITDNNEKIVKKILKESPGTELYLESCLPINADLYGNRLNNQDVKKVNSNLQTIAMKYNLTYIDLYSVMLDGDSLNKNYTKDGLHLNGEGYSTWKKALAKFIT